MSNEKLKIKLSEILETERANHNMNKSQFAVYLGISRQRLGHYVKQDRFPEAEMLDKLLRRLQYNNRKFFNLEK